MSNVGGRPTVIDKDVVQKLEQAFKDGLSVSEACFVSDIGRRTFYDHKATDEAFAHKMELAKTHVTLRAKKIVVQAINGGNLTAAKWYLERKARNEFGLHPVDEDAEWSSQTEANAQDDSLMKILATMHAVAADKVIKQTARPHHTALKVIAAELTALEPDDTDEAEVMATVAVKPIEQATVQASTSTDDVFADLYDD
ncbi:MAG TPA: hypothetical protein VLF90_00950 [Patescibacteria group bacterium]|nr:hypothetical protein [Patescibacteria group bacterium]